MNVRTFCCLLVAGISLAGVGCKSSDPKAAAISRAKGVPTTVPAVDKAPTAFQVDLLDLAMDCATAIPVEPHIKDRCRCQEAVVEACLEINAFPQAQGFAEQVKDWRRGSCYADMAIYLARHNGAADARKYLEKAVLIANAEGLESWRRDTIRQKMAQAYLWLGENPQATTIESGLSASDVGKVAGVRAARSDDAVFEAQFKVLSDLAANRDLDTASSGLESSLSLYDHFYGDSDRRALIEKMMREGWRKVPVFRQIDLALKLCDAALDHKDLAHAMALVDEAETIKNGAKWPIEYETPLTARLAAYRYRAGDLNKAGASLSAALAKYDANKKLMLDIEYVGALLPVAEAYQTISDRNGALSVYKRATEESIVNPNSRPRALDLSALCRSMALHGFEPDAALWERLRQIRKGLSDPW